MNKLVTLAAVGLISVGFASSASALTFSPAGTKFTATGMTSLTKNGVTVPCTAKFKYKTTTNGKKVKVTSATFSDASGTCAAITATNFPWIGTPTSMTTADIAGAAVTSPLGNCGPGTVPVTVSGGNLTFNGILNPGMCMVSGTLVSSPPITIQ